MTEKSCDCRKERCRCRRRGGKACCRAEHPADLLEGYGDTSGDFLDFADRLQCPSLADG